MMKRGKLIGLFVFSFMMVSILVSGVTVFDMNLKTKNIVCDQDMLDTVHINSLCTDLILQYHTSGSINTLQGV